MQIPPGTTLSLEFSLTPDFRFETNNDGYYTLLVDMPLWYAHHYKDQGNFDEANPLYYTGCFNRIVPEFYGVKNPGADCRIWDCTGERTMNAYGFYKGLGKPKQEYLPKCTATNSTGPEYP